MKPSPPSATMTSAASAGAGRSAPPAPRGRGPPRRSVRRGTRASSPATPGGPAPGGPVDKVHTAAHMRLRRHECGMPVLTQGGITGAEAAVDGDRPVRPGHQLRARVGHRPLRLPLRLLHGRGHDVPAQGRAADAGGAGPPVHRLRRAGRAQAAAHRRRAPGPAQRDVADRAARPPRAHRAPWTS